MFGTPRPELNAHAAASTAWVVPLARLTGQDRSLAGGKAVNLGEMLRAGLPVPGGFCVSTAAFRLWLDGDRTATASQEPPIQAGRDAFHCVPEFSGEDGDAVERVPTGSMAGEQVRQNLAASQESDRGRSPAAAALRQALAGVPVPAPVAQAIRTAVALRGPQAAWAVRSSATAEDLAEASFAGQHDSLLDVRGPEAVLEAVRCCWISLFTERAMSYRLKHRVPDRAVAMAVVVQEFVPAEVSGVLFTADPLTGDTRRLIIEAAPGLGDTLVSGKVSPDRLVLDKDTLRLLDQTVHRIQHPGGRDSVEPTHPRHTSSQSSTESRPTRDEPCLDEATARRLGRLGIEAERLFGAPQDLEWAARDGQVFLLQSRPITALAPRPGAEPEIWTNANVMEALPDVVTPMAWSLMRILQDDFLHPLMRRLRLDLDHWPLIDVIAGRAYLNVRLVAELVQKAAGPIRADFTVAFGGLHEGLTSVLPPESLRSGGSLHGWTWRELLRLGVWMLPGLIRQQRILERWGERVFGDLAHAIPSSLSDD